jgi:hypothetical protein
MAWATLDDCEDITGSEPGIVPGVTTTAAGTLALAHSIVRTHVGRTEAAANAMTARDLVWLREAVCWQAAWLPGQPGLLQRVGVQGVSQDGLSAQYRSHADQLLAPLAQRALKNLSWMGTRSLRTTTRPARGDAPEPGLTAASWATTDPETGWEPLH